MKKSKFTSLFVVLALGFSLVLAACNGNNHNIIYGSWEVSKAATCLYVGEEIRVCISDETLTQSRPVPALGHDYGDWVEVNPATETEKGLQRAYCKHDAAHYLEDTIPMIVKTQGEDGIFILGGFATYITETKVRQIAEDFEIYCNENSVMRVSISWRMYNQSGVANVGAAINTDGDIDALLGGGGNIISSGKLAGTNGGSPSISDESISVVINNGGAGTDTSRRHVRTNDEELTMAFWDYIFLDRAVAILTAAP